MADAATSLDILIRTIADATGIEATEENLSALKVKVQDAAKEMGVLMVSQEDVEKATRATGSAVEDVGKKIEEGGHQAGNARLQHMALHHAFSELNKICPGLGTSLDMLARGYHMADAGAKAAAVGAAEATTAFESMMATILPLLAVMLTIQAAATYWDLYKEKAKAAAEANAEACKKIEEDTRAALKAVQELDEAMHPKEKNLSEQDEEYLKEQERQLENRYHRQKELNKANEDKEMQGAATQEDKAKIREKYDLLDKQLEDWKAKQAAALEGAVAQGMEQQIKGIEKQSEELAKKQAEQLKTRNKATGEIADLETQRATAVTTAAGPNGASYQTPDIQKQAEIDAKIAKVKEAQAEAEASYTALEAQIEKLKKDSGPLGEKLGSLNTKARDDAANAEYNSDTNRRAFAVKGVNYTSPNANDHAPGPDFEQRKGVDNALPGAINAYRQHIEGGIGGQHGEFTQAQMQMIQQLATMLNAAHANTRQILQIIVDGVKKHENVQQLIAEVQQKLNNGGL